MNGWIGIDLDGTLAEYHGWRADGSIGQPIPKMIEQVKQWLKEGKDVRIMTARVSDLYLYSYGAAGRAADHKLYKQALDQLQKIKDWCREHIGKELPVTSLKDYGMITLYDDRCVQVEHNTGKLVGYDSRN